MASAGQRASSEAAVVAATSVPHAPRPAVKASAAGRRRARDAVSIRAERKSGDDEEKQRPVAMTVAGDGKPSRLVGEAAEVDMEGIEAEDGGEGQDDEDDEDGEDEEEDNEEGGEHAAVTGGGDGGQGEAPAEPVKRKRGRRKLIHDEGLRKDRRKMQCKLNQRRYRARQRGMITTLSLDAEKLADYIQELERYHRFLLKFDNNSNTLHSQRTGRSSARESRDPSGRGASRAPVADPRDPVPFSIWNDHRPLLVVKQFFRLFRNGFALHSIEISEIQEQFLRFAMDRALISQGATEDGVEALMLQLKRYSSYHAVFEMKMGRFHVLHRPRAIDGVAPPSYTPSTSGADSCGDQLMAHPSTLTWVIRVSGSLHLRLSRDTIMLIYPHVMENDDLNARVVGHEIYPSYSMVFHFNTQGKVCKLEFEVDFAAAFMSLLQDVHQTALLLDRAIISPFCELGVDPHGISNAPPKANKQLSLKFILL